MTSPHDAPPPTPFLLDRDLLDRNLEVKRSEGIPCPHCSQTMEWVLGPKTKGTILDALAQVDFHEALVPCDKDDCPGDNYPFVRRIFAQNDGTIIIETLPIDELLRETAYLRKHSKVATQNEVALRIAHQREIDNLRQSFEERLATSVTETTELSKGLVKNTTDLSQRTTEQLENAHRTIDRLQEIIAEIDGVLGVKPENRWASLKDRVAAAEQLAEICRLGNMTPDGLLKRARSWAEKQKKPKKK